MSLRSLANASRKRPSSLSAICQSSREGSDKLKRLMAPVSASRVVTGRLHLFILPTSPPTPLRAFGSACRLVILANALALLHVEAREGSADGRRRVDIGADFAGPRRAIDQRRKIIAIGASRISPGAYRITVDGFNDRLTRGDGQPGWTGEELVHALRDGTPPASLPSTSRSPSRSDCSTTPRSPRPWDTTDLSARGRTSTGLWRRRCRSRARLI